MIGTERGALGATTGVQTLRGGRVREIFLQEETFKLKMERGVKARGKGGGQEESTVPGSGSSLCRGLEMRGSRHV